MINSISGSRFRGVGVITVLLTLLFYYAVLYSLSFAAPQAVTCTDPILEVTSEADFNDAVDCYNLETSGTTVISVTNDIILTATTTQISNTTTAELIINGGNFDLDGNNVSGVRPIDIVTGTVTINELVIKNGNVPDPEQGGGIRNSGVLSLVNSQVISNTSGKNGGGIMNNVGATLSLDNVTVAENQANDDGGGIQNVDYANTLTIQNSVIRDNTTTQFSGGIGTLSPTNISSSTISGNFANNNGGGIFVRSDILTITDSEIINNDTNGDGGGIYADSGGTGLSTGTGAIMVSNTTLSGNSTNGAIKSGGAINMATGTEGSIENVTITGNDSDNGAIAIAATTDFTITHATITGNTGDGGVNNSGNLVLVNSVLANNATADCESAGAISGAGSANLIETDDGTNACGVGTLTSDPNLAALADNGGYGQTMAPNSGSPVLQAATSSCAATDQRGVSRGSSCELGAVEVVEISVVDASVLEGTGGSNAVALILTRTDASVPMSVTVNTSDDSAIAGSDYTAISNEVFGFESGQLTRSVAISITTDSDLEFDEAFDVTISNPQNSVILTSTAVVTITNDDTATISVADVSFDEGNAGSATMVFTATLDAAVTGGLDVDISAAAGTATEGVDYSAAPATLTFAGTAGETQTYSISVNGDTVTENDETVLVSLGTITPTNPALSPLINAGGTATGTITNDEPANFTIVAGSSSVAEADVSIPVTVTLSNAAAFTATVDYATADGSATAGSDYVATSGSLEFGIGETVKTFMVTVSDDSLDELDETFDIVLSAPTGVSLGSPSTATVAIIDNDGVPTIQLDPSNTYSVNESDGSLDVIVSLSNVSGVPVTATIQSGDIVDGATAGDDYTAVDTMITIPANAISQTVSIAIADDSDFEGDEQFSLIIASAGNANVSSTNAARIITIIDDEAGPDVTINNVTVSEDSVAGTAVFTVTLSEATGVPTSIVYSTKDGTATSASNDYTAVSNQILVIPAGQTSGSIAITINNDSLSEGSETFIVELISATNGTLGATLAEREGIATITDDDGSFIFLPIVVR